MKKRSYKDIEDYLEGEKRFIEGDATEGDKKFKETLELFTMLKSLPGKPAPRDFERNLYKRLGISYVPVYRKVLILAGLSIFSTLVYLTGRASLRFVSSKITLTTVSQFLSQVYTKLVQAVSLVKVGGHLKDIVLAFTNPWLFVAVAFVSSILMLMLIGLSQEAKKKTVLLRRF